MATPSLVKSDIDVGLAATKAIWDDPVLKPTAAFWLYYEPSSEWRFVVASDEVRKRGPKAVYLRFRRILEAKSVTAFPLRRMEVIDPHDGLISVLNRVVQTKEGALSSVSFLDCSFNGMRMPSMHIYMMQGTQRNAAADSIPGDAEINASSFDEEHPAILEPMPAL